MGMNFKSVSHSFFFNSLRWVRRAKVGWVWVCPFSHVEGYRGLELGISLPLGSLVSDNIPASEALVNWYTLGAGLVKNRMFQCISE